jgi:hypothetical protein
VSAILLAWATKLLARPMLLAGLLAGVLAGVSTIHHRIVVDGGMRKTITSLQQDIASHDVTIATLHRDIAQERLNVGTLTARVREQNNAIALMQLRATEADTAASLAAVRAFNQGRSAADALRAPTTTVAPGDAAMNGWLVERFK